jgi:alanine dehydrogenase
MIGVLGEIAQEENNRVPITTDSVLTQAAHGWQILLKEADY